MNEKLIIRPIEVMNHRVQSNMNKKKELSLSIGLLHRKLGGIWNELKYIDANKSQVQRNTPIFKEYKDLMDKWVKLKNIFCFKQKQLNQVHNEIRELQISIIQITKREQHQRINLGRDEIQCDVCFYNCGDSFYFCTWCFKRCNHCAQQKPPNSKPCCIGCHQGKKLCFNCKFKVIRDLKRCPFCSNPNLSFEQNNFSNM